MLREIRHEDKTITFRSNRVRFFVGNSLIFCKLCARINFLDSRVRLRKGGGERVGGSPGGLGSRMVHRHCRHVDQVGREEVRVQRVARIPQRRFTLLA